MNLRIMRLISRILASDQKTYDAAEKVHPSAALRLVCAVCTILLCAVSENAWFTLSVAAVELMRTALKPAEEVARILSPVISALLLAAAFTLPAVFMGNPSSAGTITMKVLGSVLVLSLLNEEVPWKEMTGALQKLHVPAVFIMTLDSTVRFLVILGRFSNQMIEAVSLRRVGRKKWKNTGLGGITGTTFLKSQQMAQQTSEAMICRGFTGHYDSSTRSGMSHKQAVVNGCSVLAMAALFLWFCYTQQLMQ